MDLRDDLRRNLLLSKRLERLNDQAAFLEFDAGFFGRRMLEYQGRSADLVDPVWAIGDVDGAGRNLRAKFGEVQGSGTACMPDAI